jgi:hypothetical protein
MSSKGSPSLVSESQLYRWRQRVRDIGEEVKTLIAEREKLDRLISMAEQLISEASLLEAASEAGPQHSKLIGHALEGLKQSDDFPTAVLLIVERADDGVTYEDLRQALFRSPLSDRLKKSDKGFYHAIRRGKDKQAFVEHRGYLFTPSNLKAFQAKVAAGLKQDKTRPSATGSPMTDLVLEVIAMHPGIVAKDVVARVRQVGPERGVATGSEGSIFNGVKRLKDRQEVEGFGHLDRQLRLGPKAPEEFKKLAMTGNVIPLAKRTEAPSGKAAGASASGRGGNPDLFSPPAVTRH